MRTTKIRVHDTNGSPINSSKGLLCGNNAAWLCTECGELLGSRTGDSEYIVECTSSLCEVKYEIVRAENKNGRLHLGPAKGIQKIC